MQSKQFFTVALAACFAAVGVSGNYMPDITHNLDKQSGMVFEGTNDTYVPEAVVNHINELESISLPPYNGSAGVSVSAENNGYVLRSGDRTVNSYSFADDTDRVLTATVEDGKLTFTDEYGAVVTNFTIQGQQIIYDTYGDIHTPLGVLRRNTEVPKEQSVGELVQLFEKDTNNFKLIDELVNGGTLEGSDFSSPEELVSEVNSTYLEIDGYSGYISSYSDDDVKEKLQAVAAQLEEMTVAVNTQPPSQGSGPELNMNKLIILTSVLNNTLEQKGIPVKTPDSGTDKQDPESTETTTTTTTKKTTTTTKKTTTTTKKTTKKKTTTTTTTTAAETQPPQTQAQTQQQTQAPVTTTAQRPVVTVATTTLPRFTVKEYSKTIYAVKAGILYEQPDLTSANRGSYEKYYNAACTGETSNGYYRLVVNGYTLYAPKSDFSEDPSSTIITTKAPEIKKGNINKYTKEMLTLINALRKEYGVAPLEGYEILDNAATIRAKELGKLFEHNRPSGDKYKTVFAEVGLSYHAIAENITYGMNKTYTVAEAFENWKNSQGHLNNMLNPDYKYMAIGCYSYTDDNGDDFIYWEQLFYTP